MTNPYLAIAAISGIGFFLHGIFRYSLKKAIELTPTSKAISIAPGLTEFVGKARPFRKAFTSPYQQKKCLYYLTSISERVGHGRNARWDQVRELESEDPILLKDETGEVLLKLPTSLIPTGLRSKISLGKKAERYGSYGGLLSSFKSEDPKDKLRSLLNSYASDLLKSGNMVHVKETIIEEGDDLYVLGISKLYSPNSKKMIIYNDSDKDLFCVFEGSENRALGDIGFFTTLEVLGSPLLTFFSISLMQTTFPSHDNHMITLGAALLLAMYGWLLWTWLSAVYNGLVLLRNQIERSRANIDSLLKRRHELFPNLVEVVKGYAKHEKKHMQELSEVRSSKPVESGKLLLAIAEKYPKLKANENFMALQKELTNTENQLAGSREYYNDSVMLYNKEIASFPYIIVAKAFNFKPIEYYKFKE